jgi:Cu/Ag efflux pump CusA
MAKRILAASTRWITFSLKLLYIFFGRVGSIGAMMIAVPAVLLEGMVWAGAHENHLSGFENRLWELLGAIALIGIIVLCVGLTIQKTRQSGIMKEFGETWWHGP